MSIKLSLTIKFFIGGLFIFSALSKLFPIEAFEMTLIAQGVTSWNTVTILSRIVIGLELFIGLAFFQNSFIKKFFIPLALLILVLFSIHLVLSIFMFGMKGNCGCFGEVIRMTPLEALLKNIFLMVLLIYLYRNTKPDVNPNLAVPASLLIIAISAIFIFFKTASYKIEVLPKDFNKNKKTSSLDNQIDSISDVLPIEDKQELTKLSLQFSSFHDFGTGKYVDLNNGLKIVALLSLECEDCVETAKKLGELFKSKKINGVYALFLGSKNQVASFFNKAGTQFPYRIITPGEFFPLIKNYPPRIVLLKDGKILGDWDYKSYSNKALLNAL